MAQVTGHLREDATYGEKVVLERLRTRLPPRFHIYVECPIAGGHLPRFPDLVVLTDGGVVVLEVKDWVQLLECTRDNVLVRPRQGQPMWHRNPVMQAYSCATALSRQLEVVTLQRGQRRRRVPWGYAAVLPNLKAATGLSHLKQLWGDHLVLSLDDLESQDTAEALHRILPERILHLTPEEKDLIRRVIYPVVRIEAPTPERPSILLDEAQEQIVAEAPGALVATEPVKEPQTRQAALLTLDEAVQEQDALPAEAAHIVHSGAVRLVRGVAGSGKTLVLTQRARYLAAQYPEWRICVLSYNRALADALRENLADADGSIRVNTFHAICRELWMQAFRGAWRDPIQPEAWARGHAEEWEIIQRLGPEYVADEITWCKEAGVGTKSEYLATERRGRRVALHTSQREDLWAVMVAYQQYLDENRLHDWPDVPARVWQALGKGRIKAPQYDAVLVDEAQDMAPIWMRVISRMVRPGGLLFLADDPSQSIYRFYSWREKGVHVVGRTRWLRVPYRNTREIYRAAYEVIRGDEVLVQQLGESGRLMEPDLASESLVEGSRPILQRFASQADEDAWIRREVATLMSSGLRPGQIAVLARHRSQEDRLARSLRDTGVMVATMHRLKGLEFEAVFLTEMQTTFQEAATPEAESAERRLVYMAMTRARRRLYLSYQGRWPEQLDAMRACADETPGQEKASWPR